MHREWQHQREKNKENQSRAVKRDPINQSRQMQYSNV